MEQIAKEKYSTDDLFKKREIKSETVSNNENSMIVTQKEKWYRKILNSIKNFLGKKNNNKLSVEEINQIEKQKIVRMKKYSEQLYKKVDKNTIN